MQLGMHNIADAANELSSSSSFSNVRFFSVAKTVAEGRREDVGTMWEEGWAEPSQEKRLKHFSAVCFLFAREISKFNGNKVN